MTQRKPPNVSVPDWVERQIRTAQAQGAFANLPGAGKPIPDLDRPQPELAWIAGYLRREDVDATWRVLELMILIFAAFAV